MDKTETFSDNAQLTLGLITKNTVCPKCREPRDFVLKAEHGPFREYRCPVCSNTLKTQGEQVVLPYG